MMPGTPVATTSFSAASSSVLRASTLGVAWGVAALAEVTPSIRLARTVVATASLEANWGPWLGMAEAANVIVLRMCAFMMHS